MYDSSEQSRTDAFNFLLADKADEIYLANAINYDPRDIPSVDVMKGYEQDSYRAMLVLFENSGFGAFDCNVPTIAEESR
jgi:hypothetical protein